MVKVDVNEVSMQRQCRDDRVNLLVQVKVYFGKGENLLMASDLSGLVNVGKLWNDKNRIFEYLEFSFEESISIVNVPMTPD
jgi:hypothetical protein